MENMIIAEMSRDELVRLVAEKSDTLDLDVLKQALDRIDMLDGKEKTVAESAIADINDEAFDRFGKICSYFVRNDSLHFTVGV